MSVFHDMEAGKSYIASGLQEMHVNGTFLRMCDPELFPIGTHVVINGHWSWPDDTTGKIVEFPEFVRSMRGPNGNEWQEHPLYHCYNTLQGPMIVQFVEFDEPTDDGSGDGPYQGGEVDIKCLQALSDDE